MTIGMDLNDLIKNYIEKLEDIKSQLTKIHGYSFPLENLEDASAVKKLKANCSLSNDHSVVYVISTEQLPDEFKNRAESFRDNAEGRFGNFAFSRINELGDWDNNKTPHILYVGSSKEIFKRLKEHSCLIKRKVQASQTYALHIKEWWPKAQLKVDIYNVHKLPMGEKEKDSLQIIEDLLWEKHKPLFGRRGLK